MTLEDLQHIFKPQFDEGTTKLYFMLIDDVDPVTDKQTMTITRHPANDLASLLPMLSSFEYAGSGAGMPRFTK